MYPLLTMAEVLRIPPLDCCSVVAGHRGLTRRVQSVNSFDAPDVVPWYKTGELVLTTGYVIKNDEVAQVKLVQQMAKRECAGLGIKVNHFSSEFPALLLQAADENDFLCLKFRIICLYRTWFFLFCVNSLLFNISTRHRTGGRHSSLVCCRTNGQAGTRLWPGEGILDCYQGMALSASMSAWDLRIPVTG